MINNKSADDSRIEKLLPFYCACITYKTVYNYFDYLFPALKSVWNLLYTAVTFFGLAVFIPLSLYVLAKWNKCKLLRPAFIIPLCVIINIIAVCIEIGNISILSRDHLIGAAKGTNDARGFYFAQINTWFGNMSVVMILSLFAKKEETVRKCIISSMLMLFLPSVLMVLMHPEFLGMRQSSVEGSDVVFGGGLWNIGVMGIGSISWLGLSLLNNMTKSQKVFVTASVATFAFLGIAGLSRTLILMLVLSVCFYFLIAKKDAKLLSKILLLALVVLAFVFIESDIVTSIVSRFNDSTSGSHNIRLSLWKAYLSHFKEYWLIGAPYGSVYNYYYDVNLVGEHFLPHSSVINFLVRFGLLCAISYLVLIKNAFFSIKKSSGLPINKIACIRAGFIAYVSLAFINQTGYSEPIFYIMFGLLIAYSQIIKGEEEKTNEDRNYN